MLVGPTAKLLRRMGYICAACANAAAALRASAVVIDFPGGDDDAYRPTWPRNTIDFCGRTGYARTAIDAGVPIVPMVSIGAKKDQLFLSQLRIVLVLRDTEDDVDGVIEFGDDPGCEWDAGRDRASDRVQLGDTRCPLFLIAWPEPKPMACLMPLARLRQATGCARENCGPFPNTWWRSFPVT